MATFRDFELMYHGKYPLYAMMIARDNMTPSGLLEVSYVSESYVHLCVHRFNDEYYGEMIADMDTLIEKTGGEYEIIDEDEMDCRVDFDRYFPKMDKEGAE